MTDSEIRDEWIAYRDRVAAESVAAKQSQDAVFRLFDRYRSLSSAERLVIDHVIAAELASADETARFDAVAMIDEFGIDSAVPALRALANRLEGARDPGAPFEWAKVNRLIGELSTIARP